MKSILRIAFLSLFLIFVISLPCSELLKSHSGYTRENCLYWHSFSLAQAQDAYEQEEEAVLFSGQNKIIPVNNPTRVIVNDPRIVDIASVSKNEIFVIGKGTGKTDLVYWDSLGEHAISLEVLAENMSGIKQRIDNILKELDYPDVYARGSDSEGKVLLLGSVKNAQDKERINLALDTLKGKIIDLITIKEEDTVIEIDVEVLELNSDATKTLGFTMPTSINVGEPEGHYSQTMRGSLNALFHVFTWNRELFAAKLEALIEEGKAKILSRPRLVCQSDKEADLLIGGEKPNFSTSSVSGGGSSTSIEYKEYGIKLKIKPTVKEGKQIKVALNVDISELQKVESIGSSSGGVTASAYPLTKRTASTEVVLGDGQTMAIGGLIKHKIEETKNKTAGLGDIPIIGMLFRRKETLIGGGFGEHGEVELFIALTPKIINKQDSIVKEGEKQQVNLEEAIQPKEALPTVREEEPVVLARYIQILTKRVHDNLNYPWAASQGQIEGVLKLSLNVSSAGELLGAKVVQSSGFAVLDENALKTVKEVAPFPHFPSEIKQKELSVEIPIVYNLKK